MESSRNATGLPPHSSHTPVTVTNVSKQQLYDTDLKKSKDINKKEDISGSPTPRKMPAKIFFPKDDAIKKEAAKQKTNTNTSNGPNMTPDNDEGFHDFLQKVAMVQQQEAFRQAAGHAGHANYAPPSPQSRRNSANYAMLPEYARYQEARYQRAISRGNSYSNLNASPSVSPRATTSPRVEWVPNPVAAQQRAWEEHAMMASRHQGYPSAVFCTRHEEGGVPPPVPPIPPLPFNDYMFPSYPNPNSAELSDGGSFQDHFRHPRGFQHGGSPGGSGSIPSAAALSSGSSSSWSDEEEHQHSPVARQFLDYLGGSSSSRAHAARIPQRRRSSDGSSSNAASAAPTMVEISPGVHEPLRGTEETMRAVRLDFYVPLTCFGCSLDVFSIADAKFVICPECRVVSPIEEGAWDGQKLEQRGLGLGFTCESLFQMQSEILSER
ncbi:expressed unknown protein [Seminavis robusta]|uniref:Uncharacterized protein n=1 Tax=Seminavis robusta TaxID=568900 RepID=A0A9N8DDG2_9STRA|nr:expressed unknown protein [Seminavis robusta]|eukprot:Sro97_g049820.1 n/a (437) ;mRNA; r:13994-15304